MFETSFSTADFLKTFKNTNKMNYSETRSSDSQNQQANLNSSVASVNAIYTYPNWKPIEKGCPNCGYCPCCGRANNQPYYTPPYVTFTAGDAALPNYAAQPDYVAQLTSETVQTNGTDITGTIHSQSTFAEKFIS